MKQQWVAKAVVGTGRIGGQVPRSEMDRSPSPLFRGPQEHRRAAKKVENRRQDRLAFLGGLNLSVGNPGWARGGI